MNFLVFEFYLVCILSELDAWLLNAVFVSPRNIIALLKYFLFFDEQSLC